MGDDQSMAADWRAEVAARLDAAWKAMEYRRPYGNAEGTALEWTWDALCSAYGEGAIDRVDFIACGTAAGIKFVYGCIAEHGVFLIRVDEWPLWANP